MGSNELTGVELRAKAKPGPCRNELIYIDILRFISFRFEITNMLSNLRKKARTNLEILILFFFWWAGNAIYAIDTDRLLKSSQDKTIAFELAFFQILLGTILSEIAIRLFETRADKQHENFEEPSERPKAGRISFIAGNFNYLGTLLTNFSYATLGSTSTLVWKLTEPFSVMFLKRIVLSESTTLFSVLGVVNIIVGVLWFSKNGSVQAPIFSVPIILANIAFPFRNILVKLDEKQLNRRISGFTAYNTLMYNALFIALGLAVLNTFRRGSLLELRSVPLMLKNSIYFNIYQMASIILLRKIDALSHAVGNTLKRFATIFLSVFLTKEGLGLGRMQGLLFTSIGFVIYTIEGKFSKPFPKSALIANLSSTSASVVLLCYIAITQPFQTTN